MPATCLPEPFEWIFIPAGKVTLQYPPYHLVKEHVVNVESFHISKYPVTNAQFAIFVQETGHQPRSEYWQKEHFNHPLQPVVDVFWYEAMLFCQWLSTKTGYLITLPTDAQWQRAAQGDDNRRYPWGNDWDDNRCNIRESRIGRTTRVDLYPQGASPYGVMDMVGNVNEWCLTDAKTGINSLEFDVLTERTFEGSERIFKGGEYLCSRGSANVISSGATMIDWSPYFCGIRLVTV